MLTALLLTVLGLDHEEGPGGPMRYMFYKLTGVLVVLCTALVDA